MYLTGTYTFLVISINMATKMIPNLVFTQKTTHLPNISLPELIHSLATPISTLQLSTCDETQIQEHSQVIQSCCRQLQSTIEAYLTPKTRRKIVLNKLAKRVVAGAKIRYPNQVVEILGDSKISIVGHPIWWQEMMNCLLNNACQASQTASTITLQIDQTPTDIKISISDHGRGMNWWQALVCRWPNVSFKPNGHGIGLNFVQKYVQLNGGQMHIWSKPNVGTRISLVFPREKLEQSVDE